FVLPPLRFTTATIMHYRPSPCFSISVSTDLLRSVKLLDHPWKPDGSPSCRPVHRQLGSHALPVHLPGLLLQVLRLNLCRHRCRPVTFWPRCPAAPAALLSASLSSNAPRRAWAQPAAASVAVSSAACRLSLSRSSYNAGSSLYSV